ncbi:MAG: hypothetical protein U1F66_06855 [bacterium]
MVRFPGKAVEVYVDRYGPAVPAPMASETWPQDFGSEDYFSYTESPGLDGLEAGRPGPRPNDEALVGELGEDLEGFDDTLSLELGQSLSDLKSDLESDEKSGELSEEVRGKFLAQARGLERRLLSGKGSPEQLQHEIDSLRDEWQSAVESAAEENAGRDEGIAKPRKVDARKQTAIYDADPVVALRANYDDKIHTNEVTAASVTLSGATLGDSFVVRFDEAEGCYCVTATGYDKKGRAVVEEFKVQNSQLETLTIPSNQVDVSALTDEQLAKLRIGAIPKPAREKIAVAWPESGTAGLIPNSDHANWAKEVAKRIDAAALGQGAWSEVKKYIVDELKGDNVTGYNCKPGRDIQDQELMNDVVRKVVTAIYRASHATREDDPRFVKLLQKIPQDLRLVLIDWVTKERGELSEKQGGDQWSSQETADRLQASIDLENGKDDEKKPDAAAAPETGMN